MEEQETLSSWWWRSVVLTTAFGFALLAWLAARTYKDAPPIPKHAVSQSGESLFSGDDILAGQRIFLKHGLMENGTIWGHGAYLGPDFSAEYLHTLALDARSILARQRWHREFAELSPQDKTAVSAEVEQSLKQNRYDDKSETLVLTDAEAASFREQQNKWMTYFSRPEDNGGLPANYISDRRDLRQLTAFFAWTAWAAVANRPGKLYSYTNNFPYDPGVGNVPTADAVLWSALSLIALLVGTAAVLFAFGKFDFLGWKRKADHVHPRMIPGATTESQKAAIKYFVVAALLLLAQVLVGGGTAHYRADPGTFYGIHLSNLVPSHVLRTWHLQLGILWIVTAYVAGGLFLAPSLGGIEPRGQVLWVNLLFGALVTIVAGSLLGELLGLRQLLGKFWYWFGDQGWEYLDLGRAWQILLIIGLALWAGLLARAIRPAIKDRGRGEVSSLFLYSVIAIPVFYLPALFYNANTHFSVVDMWRFWIIHLWVEDFLELFVTASIAIIVYQLGVVSGATAARVVYMDALLYLGSGIVGTGHHWYFTGQSAITMALSATFSAMEVVPLTLLTLGAWDFIQLSKGRCELCGKEIIVPHKWTFYFLLSVGFWNFVGAGVFGFLINLPIVSYFEVGTILTPNHAHAAMMGVFGMLAVALMVFAFRQVLSDDEWSRLEKYVALSFWGLNAGLALMIVSNLFPGGVLQLYDVLRNGYWHARSPEFLHAVRLIEWLRLPGDLVFIGFGVLPAVLVACLTYVSIWRRPPGYVFSGKSSQAGLHM